MFARLLLFLSAFTLCNSVLTAQEQPNIIFILCDDLGWGDLGISYQNERDAELKHRTPHLDQFAREGIQLRAHYCPAPVCAPSRASLLTGLHQGHATIRDNQFDKALPDDHTLASTLRTAGYATALIGKYGLQGQGDDAASWPAYPTKRGFDEFLGYVRHRDGHLHYPAHHWKLGGSKLHQTPKEVWHNDEEISEQLNKCFTSDLFTAYAKKWITEQVRADDQKPFFLYLAYDTPHAALQLPPCPYPAGGGLDGGVQWLGQPGQMLNTATGEIDTYIHPDHKGWPDLAQRQAGMIRRLDDHIGDLTQLLHDLEVAKNTLVVFTSDNGPHRESYLAEDNYDPEIFQGYGPFNGIKRDTLEGGIRVPTLAWWPDTIPAGRVSEDPSQFHDWMNTFLAAAGQPALAQSDGVSLLPTLTGQGNQATPTTYVEYFNSGRTPDYQDFDAKHRKQKRGQMQVLFLDGYKGLRRDIKSADDDFEIYQLTEDPGEKNNLAPKAEFADLQEKMKQTVLRLRRPNNTAKRPYDDAPVPALAPRETEPGLHARVLAGDFPWVPFFSEGLSEISPVPIPNLDFKASGKGAVEISGILKVTKSGTYTFQSKAPRALTLHLHEALVLDTDTPGKPVASGSAEMILEAGLHPIRLTYLTDGPAPALTIQGPAETVFCR